MAIFRGCFVSEIPRVNNTTVTTVGTRRRVAVVVPAATAVIVSIAVVRARAAVSWAGGAWARVLAVLIGGRPGVGIPRNLAATTATARNTRGKFSNIAWLTICVACTLREVPSMLVCVPGADVVDATADGTDSARALVLAAMITLRRRFSAGIAFVVYTTAARAIASTAAIKQMSVLVHHLPILIACIVYTRALLWAAVSRAGGT